MRQNGHGAEFTGRYDTARAPTTTARRSSRSSTASRSTKTTRSRSTRSDSGHSIAADVRRAAVLGPVQRRVRPHLRASLGLAVLHARPQARSTTRCCRGRTRSTSPGAEQMQHGRALIESRPFLTRMPDDAVIVPATPCRPACRAPARYASSPRATRPGSYAMVYAPVGRPFTVRMDKITGAKVKAWWFNPRTGKATPIGDVRQHRHARVHAARPGRAARLGAGAGRRVEELRAARARGSESRCSCPAALLVLKSQHEGHEGREGHEEAAPAGDSILGSSRFKDGVPRGGRSFMIFMSFTLFMLCFWDKQGSGSQAGTHLRAPTAICTPSIVDAPHRARPSSAPRARD